MGKAQQEVIFVSNLLIGGGNKGWECSQSFKCSQITGKLVGTERLAGGQNITRMSPGQLCTIEETFLCPTSGNIFESFGGLR